MTEDAATLSVSHANSNCVQVRLMGDCDHTGWEQRKGSRQSRSRTGFTKIVKPRGCDFRWQR